MARIRPLGPADIRPVTDLAAALTEYFNDEGLSQMARDVREQRGLVAVDDRDQVVGFVTYKHHYPVSAEITWIAVAGHCQGQGIGTNLIRTLEDHLRQDGQTRILQVKTLAETAEYEPYARTRRFYERVGFLPLQMFPMLWNADNPAKVYVKFLGS